MGHDIATRSDGEVFYVDTETSITKGFEGSFADRSLGAVGARSVDVAPDGTVWMTTDNRSIWRFPNQDASYLPLHNAIHYLLRHPDLQNTYAKDYNAAQAHYQIYGSVEGRDASPLSACGDTGGHADLANNPFDPCWYLNHHPDLAAAFGSGNVKAAYEHWIDYGIDEGRQSNANFSLVGYLIRNPDVAEASGATNYTAAYKHWFDYGEAEGRNAAP